MTATALAHRRRAAANAEPRRDGKRADMLILHYTGMASAEAACDRLVAADSGVSCHYLVDEAGAIVHMVDEDLRAWHAGRAEWRGDSDINSRSIGIEIHNPGHGPDYRDFPPAQMQAVIALARDICARHAIAPQRVLAHSDVAPGRKIDPGEKFDWAALHRAGIGHWVEPEPVGGGAFLQTGDRGEAVAALQAMLAAYGYGIAASGLYDVATADVVAAFQRHFRPARVDGVADRSTVVTLHRLIAGLPESPFKGL